MNTPALVTNISGRDMVHATKSDGRCMVFFTNISGDDMEFTLTFSEFTPDTTLILVKNTMQTP